MPISPLDFGDPSLFGNEAAEDESQEIFSTYQLKRRELGQFTNKNEKIKIARAFKGEGKSALLRIAQSEVQQDESTIVVASNGPTISPATETTSVDVATKAWTNTIAKALAAAFGSKAGMAFSDDSMSAIELAEATGDREKNIIGSLIARIMPPSNLPQFKERAVSNYAPMLARLEKGALDFWLFVDDIDQNFRQDTIQEVRIVAFFNACRALCQQIQGLRVRATIRPTTWTILKNKYESLSHVEQHCVDLQWKDEHLKAILARRVEGWLVRNRLNSTLNRLPTGSDRREDALVNLAFQNPMRWGRRGASRGAGAPPHVVLSTLSRHRPRWIIELCKSAAQTAANVNADVISIDDISVNLVAFGKRRIEDTAAEFQVECGQISAVIEAFRNTSEEMSLAQLLDCINKKVISHFSVRIAGAVSQASAWDIGNLLYRIGFINAKHESPSGGYEHTSFADNMYLFSESRHNDTGATWEIHPSFRQVLGFRDDDGRYLRPRN